LVGGRPQSAGAAPCAIVDVGHRRALDLRIEVVDQELGPITTHGLWEEVYDRVVARVRAHRTTLVFVNTRRQVERIAHALTARLGEGRVAAHHGSLRRPVRLAAEQRLKSAEMGEEELWDLVRRAWPYRDLRRSEFDGVLEILCEGIADRRGRRGAFLHRDRVHRRLRARRGARLAAITSGGAIPDTGDYDVI